MLHVALHEPEIPPNTGNVMRLCANTGTRLHLIEPLAFDLDDRRLRRAGLDYREWADVTTHPTLEAFVEGVAPNHVVACSTRAPAVYSDHRFETGDALLFGKESTGLDPDVLSSTLVDEVVRIPMGPKSRSLNLSNSVAVVLYEALRQLGFSGLS
ncbi:MAG: tRNA (cytidine(34)-2'-O)-methyltransferase [Acidimicrobiia bacterium]